MKSFPLHHKKVSNEHFMTLIFLVLVVYLIPHFIRRPIGLMIFIGLVTFGLIVDLIANMIRLKTIKCGVSAAVTVAIIVAVYPNITLSQGLLSISLALMIFKYAFGTTGQNIFNPAVTGILFLKMILGIESVFISHPITYIGLALMVPFMFFRPFSSLGMILGFIASQHGDISSGIIIWSGLIITDPVTVSPKPLIGVISFVLSFIVFSYYRNIEALCLMILFINLTSYLIDIRFPYTAGILRRKTRLRSPYKEFYTPLNGAMKPEQSADNILGRIRESQIMGHGGSGYSTYDKIMSFMSANRSDKYILINGVECDPGLIHDKWLLQNYKEEISLGIDLLKTCTGIEKAYLASKTSYKYDDEAVIKDTYPIGEERQLIKSILGIDIKNTEHPSENGILVLNVQTVLAIYKAVYLKEKVLKRYITIGNLTTGHACIKEVTIGSYVKDYIDDKDYSLFTGGIMQAKPIEPDHVIDQSFSFIGIGSYPHYKNSFCSGCGACDVHCPANLPVKKVTGLIEKGLESQLDRYNLKACISCSLCSYHCKAGKDICSLIRPYKLSNSPN
ncbi:4Fe-4S dicluster domain-containing protein [Acidaminobacter sp. JC074]|uniref:RnfABCDGE type electron transport complex subunit D n=1 Tax=Acidaminobacter sp. JC074 TaxID=2530199 RepID=UPI001F0DB31E|nr:RnfABCDGE type electron transport complex subunit D [Acidaminobacter sp. JC074]MCH4887848.1 4Fe-4S dicluster domain-containing protein [Acidaminobacter sp. JC074]